MSLKSGDKNIKAGQACVVALLMFVAFFYAGDRLLDLFSIDVASFAVAGSFVIFILALEMVLGFDIIKYDSQGSNVSVVPIAFPLLAGPGALTALLSLRADYSVINIMIGLVLNLVLAFIVIRFVGKIEKWFTTEECNSLILCGTESECKTVIETAPFLQGLFPEENIVRQE